MESPLIREAHLLEQGIQALNGLLGPEWQVTQRPNKSKAFDALLEVRAEGDSAFTQLLVEAT